MNTHRLPVLSIVERRKAGAIAAAFLALGIASCTRTRSLGSAGNPDGSDAIVITSYDASDAPADLPADSAPDAAPDAPADLPADSAPDAAPDAQSDRGPDGPGPVTCVDDGVPYYAGDIVPRGQPGCLVSCLCLGNGTVGACTGVACGADGATDGAFSGRHSVAGIVLSASTNSPEIVVEIAEEGAAERVLVGADGGLLSGGTDGGLSIPPPRSFPTGSPEVTRFLYDLRAVGDIEQVGDPGPIFGESCGKSASFGTTTKITLTVSGAISGDLQCLINPSDAQLALVRDVDVLVGTHSPGQANDQQVCQYTGGQSTSGLCCLGRGDFPDTCAVGTCTCAPSASETINTCACPTGSCFQPSVGCVGPTGVCTVGADQTCNDNLAQSSIHGRCLTGGRCSCLQGFAFVAASGKCS